MDSNAVRNYAVTVLACTVAIASIVVAYRVNQIGGSLHQALESIQPELASFLQQGKIAAFEAQATARALKQETTDPQAISERQRIFRATNVVLGETARALEQLNDGTLPELRRAVHSANVLLANTDREINQSLLPEATVTLGSMRVSINSITEAVMELAQSGRITIEEAQTLLSDPDWKEIAGNLATISADGVRTARNITDGSAHLKQASASTAEIAADIRKYTESTSKARKVTLALQIVAALLPVATFLR